MEQPSASPALFDPWSAAFVADPYPAYAELRATGRAHWFEATDQWLVPHYADVSALLRDRRLGRTYLHRFTHEEFGRTPPPPEHEPFETLNGQGLLDLEAPDHTRIRRLVSKAFTPRTVEQLVPTVRRLAAGLVDDFVEQGGGDLLSAVAEPLPVAVIAEMLGIPESDRAPLRPWSAAICGMFELNPSEETARAAVRASLEFSAYLRELIAERRANPGPDLISALVAAHDEGERLTEQEMVSTCVLLLNAGHEATVNTTVNGWWTLLRHPGQLAALRADHGLLPTALEELMRYDTPSRCSSAGSWTTSRSTARSSRGAPRWPCSSAPPTATRPASPNRTPSTSPGGRTRTSPSVPVSTSAWARRWPVSSWPPPSASCCARHRACDWPPNRSGTRATSSGG